MPQSTMHPLLREGFEEFTSGLEKILTVLGTGLTATPLTDVAPEPEEKPAKSAPAKKPKAKKPPKGDPEKGEHISREQIRQELQQLPRKTAITIIKKYTPEGEKAFLSNIKMKNYRAMSKEITAALKGNT